MMFVWNLDAQLLQRLPDTDTPNTALQSWAPSDDYLAYTYWIVGNGRYDPNPTTPQPQRRFTYKDCCSGLIIYDRHRGAWDEAGVLPFPDDQLSGWSSDGKWFAAPVSAPNPDTVLIFSVQDPRQRWLFPGLTADHIQWQPLR
jgi:Tol biopolymer transport system component